MRIIFALLVFSLQMKLSAGHYPQIDDFICGCEYCNSLNPSDPLNIGTHMVMCHSWRKGTLKTLEMMKGEEKPNIEIKKTQQESKPKIIRQEADSHVDSYNDYKWKEDSLHGWIYTTTFEAENSENTWLYQEDLGWTWTFGEDKKFLYSETYGWVYAAIHDNKRAFYFYDRRIWILASNFKKINLK